MSTPGTAPSRDAPTDSKLYLRLWLRLLSCQNIVENRIRTTLREQFGTTLPQFDVLAELEHVGRPLTMTELSRRLMVSNGNVTGVVDRLARERYVQRHPSAQDRRVHLIELTPDGLKAFRRMASQHEAWISAMFAELSQPEVEQLHNLLTRAHETLKALPEKEPVP